MEHIGLIFQNLASHDVVTIEMTCKSQLCGEQISSISRGFSGLWLRTLAAHFVTLPSVGFARRLASLYPLVKVAGAKNYNELIAIHNAQNKHSEFHAATIVVEM